MKNIQSIKENIVENADIRRTLFYSLICVFILLSAVYLYLISSITFNVLARKSLDVTVRTLENNINNLEILYLSDLNKIDKNYALKNGFVDVRENLFAIRNSTHVAIR